MLNEQLDMPDASRADLAALSERLKQLQWDSTGETPTVPPALGPYRRLPCCSRGSAADETNAAGLPVCGSIWQSSTFKDARAERNRTTGGSNTVRLHAEVKEAAAELDSAQWAKVAALAGGKRSGPDCRCHWAAALAANRAPWTPQEHARMMEIAKAHAFANVRPLPAWQRFFATAWRHSSNVYQATQSSSLAGVMHGCQQAQAQRACTLMRFGQSS